MVKRPHNIVLTGMPTSGKSTVGPLLADRLGWTFLDTDSLIEERTGRSIPDIFANDGEDAFRSLETDAIRTAISDEKRVISTGGGAILRDENRAAMRQGGWVVHLAVRPESVVQRLEKQAQADPTVVRPLLASGDPLDRSRSLLSERGGRYADCDWTVHTDALNPKQIVDEIVRGLETLRASETLQPEGAAAWVTTRNAKYPIVVGAGVLDQLGSWCQTVGLNGKLFVLADEFAATHHGERAISSLRAAGYQFEMTTVASGEKSKDLSVAASYFEWLAHHRAERRDAIVALGGGVTGDLSGYVAAAYLRGISLVQVPTTLLAMTDSAIGGKTGVNLPAGKNLVGAFHQPRLVLSDVTTLTTLPQRDLTAGWAETLKHALIRDTALLNSLETETQALLALDPDVVADVVGRSAAVKAGVVSADEREDGLRMILNYGHTYGHALEAAAGYTLLLHGEAVAIGMRGAGRLSVEMGLLSKAELERQDALLAAFGLPIATSSLDRDSIYAAMKLDKKVTGKTNRWILLDGIGKAVVRSDVPAGLVETELAELIR